MPCHVFTWQGSFYECHALNAASLLGSDGDVVMIWSWV